MAGRCGIRGLVFCWVLAAWAASATPAFAAPGDVVSAAPATFVAEPILRVPIPGVSATHVLYRSTDVHGSANVVSGTILVPTTPYAGPRPIVGYAMSTHGLGDACAPSAQMAEGLEIESDFLMGLLNQGWAVAVTDYEGLGTPGQHTYYVGPSLGHAVLDSIRAATRAPGTGLVAGGPVAIWGYSEGGSAAAWAAQLQPAYAPELHVVGVAAGGVAADVAAFAEGLDGGALFGIGVSTLIGLDAAFPELHLSAALTDAGRQIFSSEADACLVGLLLPPLTFGRFAALTTSDVFARPDVQAAFAESRLGATRPLAPLLLYHAVLDEIVPFAMGRGLRDRYCADGATVEWLTFPVAEHLTTTVEAGPEVVAWLAGRFAGVRAPNDCPAAAAATTTTTTAGRVSAGRHRAGRRGRAHDRRGGHGRRR